MRTELFQSIASNKRKSALLVFFMLILTVGAGFAIAYAFFGGTVEVGVIGLAAAFAFSLIMACISYFSGDMIMLALGHAREADKVSHQKLYNVVEEISLAAGLPMPRVFVIDDPAPNAFATGRNPKNSAVAVTTGLLDRLDRDELQGVIAHELSHIGNYDILYAMMVGVLVGTIVILSDIAWRSMRFRSHGGSRRGGKGAGLIILIGLVFIILAPIFATMVQFAISRRREYLADATGAKLSRFPEGLARALEKIVGAGPRTAAASRAMQHLYIVNPFRPTKSINALFDTHPPIQDRIARLRSM